MKKIMLFTLSVLILAQNGYANNLCLTNRGNGFKIFSHFGAIANIVETRGLPDAITGNSSAAVSAFLLSSMKLNRFYPEGQQAESVALMLKSIPYGLEIIANDMKVEKIAALASSEEAKKDLKKLMKMKDMNLLLLPMEILKFIVQYSTSQNIRQMLSILNGPYVKEIINPEFLSYLEETKKMEFKLANRDAAENKAEYADLEEKLQFRKDTVDSIFASFKNFAIEEDYNTYFKPGLVNQKGVAKIWDRLASFYAGYNFTRPLRVAYQGWLKKCSLSTKGKDLAEIEKENPKCIKKFQSLYKRYLSNYNTYEKRNTHPICSETNSDQCLRYRYLDPVGKAMPVFIASSAIIGDSKKRYHVMEEKYQNTSDKKFGQNFAADLEDFKVAVWARPEDARTVKDRLAQPFYDPNGRLIDFSQDFRAQRIHFMNPDIWQNALFASTSEPGQTSPVDWQKINGQDVLTTGGWEGLQFTEVLKAIDCRETIAIVTEVHHGNHFFENAAKHLMQENMNGLNNKSKEDLTLGTEDDLDSAWSQWKNWLNPNSANNRSLDAADAVYCTNWDAVSAFSDEVPMEEHLRNIYTLGYKAPVFINEGLTQEHSLWESNFVQIKREENVWSKKENRPRYHGCIPYN